MEEAEAPLCGLALQGLPLEVVALQCANGGFKRLSGIGIPSSLARSPNTARIGMLKVSGAPPKLFCFGGVVSASSHLSMEPWGRPSRHWECNLKGDARAVEPVASIRVIFGMQPDQPGSMGFWNIPPVNI